ncbi:hypothetical protein SAMN05660903_00288 [Salegentibacter salinarum]|nr:hypothetical protein SAMN05660903_00288 [Salegentibacter salinarum]
MSRFKIHITIFLLVGFLIPQVTSALHYWVVPHNNYKSGKKITIKVSNNFEYHSCTYHLNGVSPSILGNSGSEKFIKTNLQGVKIKFCCLENYVHQPDYNFLLRGPPVTVLTALLN